MAEALQKGTPVAGGGGGGRSLTGSSEAARWGGGGGDDEEMKRIEVDLIVFWLVQPRLYKEGYFRQTQKTLPTKTTADKIYNPKMKAQNMSPLVSANPLGTFDFPLRTLIRSDAAFGFPRVRSKRPCSIKSDIRFVCASSKQSPSENSDEIGADEHIFDRIREIGRIHGRNAVSVRRCADSSECG
ncbi:hypothetical protein QJS10_CPB04g00625 [Acorus calamus]|uniref:Uncharacterized protein n=1 Tax=Acorus calamus TaxID=4465 RepID=A0AAV9F144_ACOCL|nr:hypothetical protein QJS10_CPB04g00625 [Acorus calamus]